MSAYSFGSDHGPSVSINENGGVNGTTTEASREANAAASETERTIEEANNPITGTSYTEHAFG